MAQEDICSRSTQFNFGDADGPERGLAQALAVRRAPPARLLIVFRDSLGRVGIMDHRCPHRCASLFLGRNEENGIRCVYHGWKNDTQGDCVDMPNAPPHHDFKDKVKAKAYKVTERNGVVWVYMGARKEAPPLPAIEAALMPETELQINFVQRECNWLQALEGDIDTSHFGFVHTDNVPPDSLMRWTVTKRAPEYHITDTDYGTMYCPWRDAYDIQMPAAVRPLQQAAE